jgi:hypothetical protein
MTSGDPAAQPDAKGGRTTRWLTVIAKCGVSVGLLWALFASYDLTDTLDRIAAIDPGLFAVAFSGELVNVLLVTGRWLMVLGALGLTPGFAAALALVFIGLFFNQALPSNIGGDAMRVWRLFRTGSSLGRAVGSVMLDRVLAMVGLALVVVVGLTLNPGLIADGAALAVLWAMVGAVLGGAGVLLVFDRLLAPLRRILPDRAVGAGSALARDARAALLDRRRGPALIAVSMAAHVLNVGIVYALAIGLGIDVRFGDMVALVPPVILVAMLPISFGGWGVREGAMIAALAYAGVPADAALALSVAFGLAILLCALPGAPIWFVTGNRLRAAEP